MTEKYQNFELTSGLIKHKSTEYKRHVRDAITEHVGDTKDNIADSFKLHAVLAELVLGMYDALPDNIKNNLPSEQRLLMDYVLRSAVGAGSRYKDERDQEGYDFLFRIIERQKEVSEVMTGMNYETYKEPENGDPSN